MSGSGYFGVLKLVFPVIESTSSTSLKIWNGHAGNYSQGYTGAWSPSVNNTYTLYPMAEVLHVNNGTNNLSATIGLSANTVAWATNDTVEEPPYFTLTSQLGNINNFRTWPTGQIVGGWNFNFGGNGFASASGQGGVGVQAQFEHVTNNNSYAFYTSGNNKIRRYLAIRN